MTPPRNPHDARDSRDSRDPRHAHDGAPRRRPDRIADALRGLGFGHTPRTPRVPEPAATPSHMSDDTAGNNTASNDTAAELTRVAQRLDALEHDVREVRTRINALFFAVLTAALGDLAGRLVLG